MAAISTSTAWVGRSQLGDLLHRRTTRHYPLNEDFDFESYEHRPLGVRDMMVHHIMENYMFPGKVKRRTLHQKVAVQFGFGPIKSEDRELGLDLQLVEKMLLSEWDKYMDFRDILEPPIFLIEKLIRHVRASKTEDTDQFISGLLVGPLVPRLHEMVLGLVQRHYLEVTDPSLRMLLGHMKSYHIRPTPNPPPGWKGDMIEHLKSYKPSSMMHQRYQVFSGGFQPPANRPGEMEFSVDPYITWSAKAHSEHATLRQLVHDQHSK
ncbi:hypothetical protein BJ170DRAFT_680878 [Xylariales sp. AK1849]|nr:hypothetical protein BJ170DRAFT_680878 [Xylariales sp. AK1849]